MSSQEIYLHSAGGGGAAPSTRQKIYPETYGKRQGDWHCSIQTEFDYYKLGGSIPRVLYPNTSGLWRLTASNQDTVSVFPGTGVSIKGPGVDEGIGDLDPSPAVATVDVLLTAWTKYTITASSGGGFGAGWWSISLLEP